MMGLFENFFHDAAITLTTGAGLAALAQVIIIDLVLAGDNAIIIGLAVAGLDPSLRKRAIVLGILAATAMRLGFAVFTLELLEIVGLLLAGGLLLLWVCWRMWRDLRGHNKHGAEALDASRADAPKKTFGQAAMQIMLADVSMSLDNVLAVAGAAREHPAALVFGLLLSIVLMGFAANFVARLINKHRWLAYLGLVIVLYVALAMVYKGFIEVKPHLTMLQSMFG